MNNIATIKDCYGCGVCATVCSMQIISIRLNDDGFYEPKIDDLSKCSNCGLCLDVCAYSHDDIALKDVCIHSYGAWSKNEAVRRKCSSGGVGFELGKALIDEGYKVCGVRYNPEQNRAEHYIATTVEELIPSIGSKYIQSYTVDCFKSIDRKQKYLVTGTPCQIDSFRRCIQKFKKEDNFILMDFFCHGVPSKLMWDKYVKWAETKVGKLTYVSWRNKFTGWHDSWAMSIDGEEHGNPVNWHGSYNMLIKEKKGFLNSRLSQGDMFYRLFLSDACLGKACYEKCKYKYNHSSADIRIGDAWGNHYADNEKGVNSVIAFSVKGDNLLHRCNCKLEDLPFDTVAEWQMKNRVKCPSFNNKMMKMLKDETMSIEDIIKQSENYLRWKKLKGRLFNPKRTIKNILKRLKK